MKQLHESLSSMQSFVNLAAFGQTTADWLTEFALQHTDLPGIFFNEGLTDSQLLRNNHTQINGNPMVISLEDNIFSYSKASKITGAAKSDTAENGPENETPDTTDKNLHATAPGYGESPSRISLMRLHEFLLMEQLMQD